MSSLDKYEDKSIREYVEFFLIVHYQYIFATLFVSFISGFFDIKTFKNLMNDWENRAFDFPLSIIISLFLFELFLVMNLFCLYKTRFHNNGFWTFGALIFGVLSFIYASVGYIDLLVILGGQYNHILCFLVLLAYFFPFTIAHFRNHHNQLAIFFLNLLLGWTVIGWVIALVMSLTKNFKK